MPSTNRLKLIQVILFTRHCAPVCYPINAHDHARKLSHWPIWLTSLILRNLESFHLATHATGNGDTYAHTDYYILPPQVTP